MEGQGQGRGLGKGDTVKKRNCSNAKTCQVLYWTGWSDISQENMRDVVPFCPVDADLPVTV